MNVAQQIETITAEMRAHERIIVAFSGGVDSAVVAALAFRALGTNARAVTAVSATLAGRELDEAVTIAGEIGIPHETMRFSELDNPKFTENTSSRCFFCQSMRFDHLRVIADRLGADVLASGTNADDIGDDRPGLAAMEARGIYQPLLKHNVSKAGVREFAQFLGLSVWDKPAAACLSSRIPHGQEVTYDRLKRIELAEEVLHGYGFRHFRVRDHEGLARIEVAVEELERIFDPAILPAITREIRSAGFRRVAIDLCGYRAAGRQ